MAEFFLQDVFWSLSSYRSNALVRRCRHIDENDAWRGFMRRKTAEEILQLPEFDKVNGPPRAEYILYCCLQCGHFAISVTPVAASTMETFGGISVPSQPPVWTGHQRKQSSRSSHIQDTLRLSRLSGTWEIPRSLYWMLLYSYTIGHCSYPKGRADKWEEMNYAEYHRTLTRSPATAHIGFWTPEGLLKVRRLITSALADSCLIILLKLVFW